MTDTLETSDKLKPDKNDNPIVCKSSDRREVAVPRPWTREYTRDLERSSSEEKPNRELLLACCTLVELMLSYPLVASRSMRHRYPLEIG